MFGPLAGMQLRQTGIQMLAKFPLFVVFVGLSGAPVFAQTASHSPVEGMNHDDMQVPEVVTVLPDEPGQGAFAAISEIVTMLATDPATDWSKVNITGLRNHLVDMDNMISDSVTTSRNVPGGLEISVDLGAPGNEAASRMVPAHAPFVQAEAGWANVVTMEGDTLVWTVTSDADETQIRGLGFFGLMATGDHHRAHHLGMAKGTMLH
jgi:hypothetical protein